MPILPRETLSSLWADTCQDNKHSMNITSLSLAILRMKRVEDLFHLLSHLLVLFT